VSATKPTPQVATPLKTFLDRFGHQAHSTAILGPDTYLIRLVGEDKGANSKAKDQYKCSDLQLAGAVLAFVRDASVDCVIRLSEWFVHGQTLRRFGVWRPR